MPALGHKYILSVVDLATRCIVPAVVQTRSTKDVAAHLHQVLSKFGATIYHPPAYRAGSNGLVHRRNGALVTGLRRICDHEQDQLPIKLDEAVFQHLL